MGSNNLEYGVEDSSYKAAGELPGLTKLVDAFYNYMDSLPEAEKIRSMHKSDLSHLRKRLTYFLCGWLGGPRLYSENFGSISIPGVHQHLSIGHDEEEAWILCMQKAVADQDYEQDFKIYLIEQLRVPAERVRIVCSR